MNRQKKGVSRLNFEQRMYQSLKRKGLAPQFEKAGVYAILLDGNIVYIGKSRNMLYRMAQHYTRLAVPNEHKYEVLKEATARGHRMRFCVLYHATSSDGSLEEELGAMEGTLIRKHRPPLNYQIPTAENWRKFTTNPSAKTISLSELLEKGNSA